jgi:hypothetical protein
VRVREFEEVSDFFGDVTKIGPSQAPCQGSASVVVDYRQRIVRGGRHTLRIVSVTRLKDSEAGHDLKLSKDLIEVERLPGNLVGKECSNSLKSARPRSEANSGAVRTVSA